MVWCNRQKNVLLSSAIFIRRIVWSRHLKFLSWVSSDLKDLTWDWQSLYGLLESIIPDPWRIRANIVWSDEAVRGVQDESSSSDITGEL